MSRVNEMENAADELRDMRLDIDGMSYEVNFKFILPCCILLCTMEWRRSERRRE